jgi:hypothetical protein
VNQALTNAQDRANQEFGKATGGLLANLPGDFKLPGL